MESNPTRMCELLVGLPAVTVLGIDDVEDGPIRVHLERSESRTGCPACGVVAESKGRRLVELVDLPVSGRSSRLLWHKRRFVCRDVDCEHKTWTEVDERIAHFHRRLCSVFKRRRHRQPGKLSRWIIFMSSLCERRCFHILTAFLPLHLTGHFAMTRRLHSSSAGSES